jgi:AAA+ ATPase superfamily predicted ATPase
MKFINRKKELSRLNHLIRLPGANTAVIWGRRRVGKSRLLLEWARKYKGVYYTADESTASIQRKYFATAIQQVLPGFSELEYPDWATLFSRLAREAIQAKWRGPIVIDELPYLITVSPELPSILQRFIDIEAKKAKLIIALCGSSQRMMQGAILDHDAPLYGRAQEIIKLSPISIGYMGEALKLKSPRAIVESYAIWGGIPRYWELVEKSRGSFVEKIERIVLDPMGVLHEEPSRLLLEESAVNLRPILDAIGFGAHRLSEVATRMGQPATSLMRPIQRLVELDLIQRELPYGTDENNSKRSLYSIKDPFLRFWFNVVASRRSLFSQVTTPIRIEWLKQALPHLFSIAWEELCRFAVPFLSMKLGQEFYEQASRFWHGQGAEWDILAKSEKSKTLLIGEAKWLSKSPSTKFVHKAIEELKNKGIPPVPRHSNEKIQYVLFIPEKPRGVFPPDVKIIDAKEVITALR